MKPVESRRFAVLLGNPLLKAESAEEDPVDAVWWITLSQLEKIENSLSAIVDLKVKTYALAVDMKGKFDASMIDPDSPRIKEFTGKPSQRQVRTTLADLNPALRMQYVPVLGDKGITDLSRVHILPEGDARQDAWSVYERLNSDVSFRFSTGLVPDDLVTCDPSSCALTGDPESYDARKPMLTCSAILALMTLRLFNIGMKDNHDGMGP